MSTTRIEIDLPWGETAENPTVLQEEILEQSIQAPVSPLGVSPEVAYHPLVDGVDHRDFPFLEDVAHLADPLEMTGKEIQSEEEVELLSPSRTEKSSSTKLVYAHNGISYDGSLAEVPSSGVWLEGYLIVTAASYQKLCFRYEGSREKVPTRRPIEVKDQKFYFDGQEVVRERRECVKRNIRKLIEAQDIPAAATAAPRTEPLKPSEKTNYVFSDTGEPVTRQELERRNQVGATLFIDKRHILTREGFFKRPFIYEETGEPVPAEKKRYIKRVQGKFTLNNLSIIKAKPNKKKEGQPVRNRLSKRS